jgi:hypothetical protein
VKGEWRVTVIFGGCDTNPVSQTEKFEELTGCTNAQQEEGKSIGELTGNDKEYCRHFAKHCEIILCRCSAVGIATAYGLDDRGVGVRVPVTSRIFTSSYHSNQF